MKVILLGELRGKGGEGDIVEVAQGYAENFLFPNKIAQPATPGNIKQLEERRHNIAKREEQRIADANATQLNVTVDRKRIARSAAIKTAGRHNVTIELYRDITATVVVLVGKDDAAPVEEETEEVVAEATVEVEVESAE